jgi:hypothetical protein
MQKVKAKIKVKFPFLFDHLHGPSQMHKLLILVQSLYLEHIIQPHCTTYLFSAYSQLLRGHNPLK